MRITKLIFIETPPQAEQYIRPFNTHVTQPILDHLSEATEYGCNINPIALQSVASEIMMPAAQHEGLAAIVNGWNTKRYRFFMEVEETKDAYGNRNLQLITGFTDYLGSSLQRTLDPAMRLYFNSTVTVKDYKMWGDHGVMINKLQASGSSQILNGERSIDNFSGNHQRAIRPDDIFTTLSTDDHGRAAEVVDSRVTFVTGPLRTHRNNTHVPEYLNRALSSYSMASQKNSGAFDQKDVHNVAKSYARDPSITSDLFFGKLRRETLFGKGGFATYRELINLSPDLDSITKVLSPGAVTQSNNVMGASNGASWAGANYETVEAVHLMQAIPSLMMELMISFVDLSSSNDTIGGRPVVTINGVKSFTESVDMRPYVQHFIQRWTHEFMPGLTKFGNRKVNLQMRMDLSGTSMLNIAFDNNHSYQFVSPTFSDGVFSPLITNAKDTLFNISNDLNTVFNNIDQRSGNAFSPAPAKHRSII